MRTQTHPWSEWVGVSSCHRHPSQLLQGMQGIDECCVITETIVLRDTHLPPWGIIWIYIYLYIYISLGSRIGSKYLMHWPLSVCSMSGAIFDTGTTHQASRIFLALSKKWPLLPLTNRTPGYARSSNLSNQCALCRIPPLQVYTYLTITIINYLHLRHRPAKPRHCPPCPPVPLVQEQE